MLPKIHYYDFYLGDATQAPTGWLLFEVKLPALNVMDAVLHLSTMGVDVRTVMRADKYDLHGRNGRTVVQYRKITFVDLGSIGAHSPLSGLLQRLSAG